MWSQFHILEINILVYFLSCLCSMLLAVHAISIKKTHRKTIYTAVLTYVAMVFCWIQHILEVLLQVYHSFCEDCHRSSYLVHQHGGCFLFSFIILNVMTSHENAHHTPFMAHHATLFTVYLAMQVQWAVMICPSLFTATQAMWGLSKERWLGFTNIMALRIQLVRSTGQILW